MIYFYTLVYRTEGGKDQYSLLRAKVPGGWLVQFEGSGITFYPDPKHEWDGSSLK